MKRTRRLSAPTTLLLAAAGVLAAGWGGCAPPADAQRASPAATADWCVEHAVPESRCSLCNPSLVPALKASGDWCAEHGLPESICPACRPGPAGAPTAEPDPGPPADGTLVLLAGPQVAQRAGLLSEPVVEGPLQAQVEVLGSIAWDPTRHARLDARVAGVVGEVLVELGDQVEPGQPLVRLDSAEVGALRARLTAAAAKLAAAQPALQSARALLDAGLGARQDVQDAEAALAQARAEHDAARAALELAAPAGDGADASVLRAPFAGTCVRLAASPGCLVGAGEPLCEIVDASRVWAELQVPEAQLARVHAGQAVVLDSGAPGGTRHQGVVDHVAPAIDPATRTATARVRLDNPDGSLRAGLFVRGVIVTGSEEARVLVPRAAVQRARGVDFVFVELGPGRYEAQRAQVVGAAGDRLALAAGARAGERVATTGAFLLKTEIFKGDIGAGCCPEE